MKRKMKLLLLPLLFGAAMLLSQTAQAQKYTIAAGWRSGWTTNGISAKLVPVKGVAIEGIYGLYPYGQSITGLVESHSCVFGMRALQMYAGAGAHYRFNYMDGVYTDPFNGTFEVNAPPGTRGWGLDAVLGIEWKLPILPIAVSAEVKPMVEWANSGASFTSLDPGVGIKLAF